jgi:hypothetical protein
MEIDAAILFGALDHCTDVGTFFAADDTPDVELAVIELIHLYWSPWGHLRTWHPEGATVMHPMI